MKKLLSLTLTTFLGSSFLLAEPAATSGSDVLERYLTAARDSQQKLRGYAMEVNIDAELPKLNKRGALHALRRISSLGRVTYDGFRWAGDNLIKTDVIARYLKAEVEAGQGGQDISISPANYKFKYKGLHTRDDRQVYVFELKPHKKRVGLFKGELWVDADTHLPVRESGEFVKNPSVFLKKMAFIRDYEIRDGIAFPARIESKVDTRLIGRTDLTINFSNFNREEQPQKIAEAIDVQ